jgi:hypothetical protein
VAKLPPDAGFTMVTRFWLEGPHGCSAKSVVKKNEKVGETS